MRQLLLVTAVPLALAAGCGTSSGGGASPTASTPAAAQPPAGTEAPVSAEKNPPGDIPDNIAFVRYTSRVGKYSFTHPEGWAETSTSTAVTLTDKLNGVHGETGSLTTPPTVDSAKAHDIPALRRSQAAFELRGVTSVQERGGSGVRIVYRRNSAPDPVTGRQYRDEVERYELVAHGREVIIELFGPVGADNVDAYRTMIASLQIT